MSFAPIRGNIRIGKFRCGTIHLNQIGIRDSACCQKYIHMPRHPARDRVDGVLSEGYFSPYKGISANSPTICWAWAAAIRNRAQPIDSFCIFKTKVATSSTETCLTDGNPLTVSSMAGTGSALRFRVFKCVYHFRDRDLSYKEEHPSNFYVNTIHYLCLRIPVSCFSCI